MGEGWGPNGRAWFDDEFWMDVLIQGVGWILIATTIAVSARQFYLQRQHAIADDAERRREEREREEKRRQVQLADELLATIVAFRESPSWLFMISVWTLPIADRGLAFRHRLQGFGRQLADPHLRAYCDMYAEFMSLQKSRLLVPLYGGLWLNVLADHAAVAASVLARYLNDDKEVDLSIFQTAPVGPRFGELHRKYASSSR